MLEKKSDLVLKVLQDLKVEKVGWESSGAKPRRIESAGGS